MALELVNTSPGKDQRLLRPGGLYHFGLGSDAAPVILGTLRLSVGSSDLRHHSVLPEEDQRVAQFGTVGLYSTERRQPIGVPIDVSMSGDDLAMARATSDQADAGIYEVTVPVSREASVLAYAKIRLSSWTPANVDWCSKTGMVAPYFGIRYGQYASGAFVFLRDAGAGEAIIAGPLQALNAPRQVEHAAAFGWKTLPVGQTVEFWIYVNHSGFGDFVPPSLPTVEVWGALQGSSPALLHRFTLTAGGQFRYGTPEDSVTLFFGNAGQGGDLVTFADWAVYRDYRLAVAAGQPRSGHIVKVAPDLPVAYRVGDTKDAPTEMRSNRWFKSTDPYSLPHVPALTYQPGRRAVPAMATLSKAASIGHMSYERDDTRVAARLEGFMLEMVAQAQTERRDGDSTGVGMEVDDGSVLHRLLFIDDGDFTTVGLAKSGASTSKASYAMPPSSIDHSSLKLYRMTFDRALGKLDVAVDGVRVLSYATAAPGNALPPSSGRGRVRIGHIADHVTQAIFGLSQVYWMNRYLSWDASELPRLSGLEPVFVWEDGATSTYGLEGSLLEVRKQVRNEIGSKGLFFTDYDFTDDSGAFVEFKMAVRTYTNGAGTPIARGADTGVSLTLHFGTTKLQVAFMDAGLNGRFVCILGAATTKQDFVEQTAAGRARSVRSDWMEMRTYRLHVTPTKIELWTDSVVGEPSLTIASVVGLGLPEDTRETPGLSFGHSEEAPSSVSEWLFVHFGTSSGYDVGVEQIDADPPADKFDGRATYQISFGDGT